MNRKILLVEPNYANKYPPIGLMKIATYHRILKDNVRFFKGNLNDLVADYLFEKHLPEFAEIDGADWRKQRKIICSFIKTKNPSLLPQINLIDELKREELAERLTCLADVIVKRQFDLYPKFDRVYVTTLFTFYWNITVKTIKYCKNFVSDPKSLYVGGIMATLLANELEKEVGIVPRSGILDEPGMLDPGLRKARGLVIDDLPLDYSILDEIDYIYPTQSAYFTFMTKGCTRKCAFCSVPVLEPTYKPKIETTYKYDEIKATFGDQQNLLLMDNNVLASPNFDEIVDEIKSMGFSKGAKYVEPNQLEIVVQNLKKGHNDYAYTRRSYRLLDEMRRRVKKPIADVYEEILARYDLLTSETVTKENILAAYPHIADIYEKYRNKTAKARYVDFNQGTDCRYVTPEKMKKMSEIAIRPLRIAFDHVSLKKQYEKAIKLAEKNGITVLSNYILYNFNDRPEDLWDRLKFNIELCEELDIEIFSFPMKYIPLFGDEAKDRKHVGKYWNRKFIRAVQSILNVTKGIVAPPRKIRGTSFFEEAFGANLEEFKTILYMPETYIVYRKLFRDEGYTSVWLEEFRKLKDVDLDTAKKIINTNNFSAQAQAEFSPSRTVQEFLRHYLVPRSVVDRRDARHEELKTEYDRLIKDNQFIDLTLTYDFDVPKSAFVITNTADGKVRLGTSL